MPVNTYKNSTIVFNQANFDTTVPIIISPPDRFTVIQELMLYVNISSLEEVPLLQGDAYLTQDEKAAAFWSLASGYQNFGCKVMIGDGVTWTDLFAFLIFKRLPYYTEDIIPRLTNKNEFILAPGKRLALRFYRSQSFSFTANDKVTLNTQHFINLGA